MFDTSTLNQDALRRLRPYTCPPSYHIDTHLGAGCAGDPPGFPTYFLRSVYTKHGDPPPEGPTHVIQDADGIFRCIPERTWMVDRASEQAAWEDLMRSLWSPLPYTHPRVRAWIVTTYQHFKHCYKDIGPGPYLKPPEYGQPATLIFPVPDYELERFEPDPRFSTEYNERRLDQIAEKNRIIRNMYRLKCQPEVHSAFLIVSRYYPEHTPDLALIADPGTERPGDWWETEDVQPLPSTCTAGEVRKEGKAVLFRGCAGHHGWTHPTGQTWCQWCGWSALQEPQPPREVATLPPIRGEAVPRTCHDCLPGDF